MYNKMGYTYVKVCKQGIIMSVKPYTNLDDDCNSMMAAEPAMQEMIAKRKYSLAKAMETSMTVEELDRHLTELIHRHYHPEA